MNNLREIIPLFGLASSDILLEDLKDIVLFEKHTSPVYSCELGTLKSDDQPMYLKVEILEVLPPQNELGAKFFQDSLNGRKKPGDTTFCKELEKEYHLSSADRWVLVGFINLGLERVPIVIGFYGGEEKATFYTVALPPQIKSKISFHLGECPN